MTILFNYAFRSLFLLATLYAIVVVPLWAAAWLGYLPMPTSLGPPSWWHAHEMIYGFAGAAIGGLAAPSRRCSSPSPAVQPWVTRVGRWKVIRR